MTVEVPVASWAALGYTPNKWQYENVHIRPERFIAGCTCRQCGKTTAMAAEIHKFMTEPRDSDGDAPLVGVMAVDFPRAELSVMRWHDWYVLAFGPDSLQINKNEHFINLPNGAKLRWFSAENPLGAAGYTFNAFFFDESQWISNNAWVKTRPAFQKKNAFVRAFGTPDTIEDAAWFRGLILRGADEDDPNHYSFGVDVWANPYATFEEILETLQDMTDDEIRML